MLTRSTATTGDRNVAVLEGAVKKYGSVVALDGVDLEVRRGELLSLLGHNGAGKTTAIRLLLGVSSPTAGSARVFGQDPHRRSARTRIGAGLQVSGLPGTLTVREHVTLFSSYYPRPFSVARTLELAQLEPLAHRRLSDLSGGQRQRVFFALAICGNPDLLVLDEPTVGLDVESRRLMWDRVRAFVRDGKSVLLTTHYLEEADALADRIVVLARGKIIADGTPAEIKARARGTVLRCQTALDIAVVRDLPGVESAHLAEHYTEVQTQAPDAVLQSLYAHDAQLRVVSVTNAALEDAFLALTKEAA
jgi:ABC-2 type transport system ATP-binding protein